VLSDIHGEYDAFHYFVRSGSGMIRMRIDEVYGKTLSEEECDALASLIYNPEAELARRHKSEDNFDAWCKTAIIRLISICRVVSNKYTRSKVKKLLPEGSAYIMDELLFADDVEDRHRYYDEIIDSIIEYESAEDFIVALTGAISDLTVDRLHIIGDIFDRGPKPHVVMDYLMATKGVDIQWGNHDMLWMGAACGNRACIANLIRINVRYNNFDMLELGYGINLRPLSYLAQKIYGDDPCECFWPKILETNTFDNIPEPHVAKMHKMIAIIQFKIEGQEIMKHPEYQFEDRMLLDKIDYKKGTVKICGKEYELTDTNFPTIDPADPYKLTDLEEEVMIALEASMLKSEKLQRHIDYMLSHGSFYKISNGNLFYHGSVPFTEDGELKTIKMEDGYYRGRSYLDKLESMVRKARNNAEEEGGEAASIMWYLWMGKESPLFGKDRMVTFETLLLEDEEMRTENMVPYYQHLDTVELADKVLEDFGLDVNKSKIFNGHVPVKFKDGESPIKGGGKIFLIDGGISKAYHKTTGIAGYTAILTSKHMYLAEHKPYQPLQEDGSQVFTRPKMNLLETENERLVIRGTDNGAELQRQIKKLEELNEAFKEGYIKERW